MTVLASPSFETVKPLSIMSDSLRHIALLFIYIGLFKFELDNADRDTVQAFWLDSVNYFILLSALSYFDNMTVQLPHPPSPHPSFVPFKYTEIVFKE